MKALITIFFIILLTGCKQKTIVITNLNNDEIEVMGHAGMGFSSLYPINTNESILKCLSKDSDGTEIDIQLTKDNILVLFHDSGMAGSTNFNGNIRDFTWDELKEARYNATPQLNYKLVRLRDLFIGIGNIEDYIFTLDIKLYYGQEVFASYVEDFTNALANLYDDYEIYNNVFIESQSTLFLDELHTKDTQIGRYIYPQSFAEGYNTALDFGLKGISIHNDLISKEDVELAHSKGIFVTIWGVKSSKKNLDAVNKNPDMIQTDNINYLVKLIK